MANYYEFISSNLFAYCYLDKPLLTRDLKIAWEWDRSEVEFMFTDTKYNDPGYLLGWTNLPGHDGVRIPMMSKKMFKDFFWAAGPPGVPNGEFTTNIRGVQGDPDKRLVDRLINFREYLDIKSMAATKQFELVLKLKVLHYGPVVREKGKWGYCTFKILRDAFVNALGFWDLSTIDDPGHDDIAHIFSLQTQIAEMPKF